MISGISRAALAVVAAAQAAAEDLGVEGEPHEQAGHDRQQAGDGHDRDVLVGHVGQLVREDALELLLREVQRWQHALGDAQHRVLAVAAGREGVRHLGRCDRHPGLVHVRERAQPVDDAVQLGRFLAAMTSRAPAAARAILSL